MKFDQKKLTSLRHQLHKNAELAFKEKTSVQTLKKFILSFEPDEVIEQLGETGIAFIFKGDQTKPNIMFRADLDALPIHEKQNKDYVSVDPNVSHMCGHDGHMTMVAAIATQIQDIKNRGDIILLFQPAEEIGEGAKSCCEDPKFKQIKADYIFGLHNLPEYPAKEVVIKKGCFACSSVGLEVKVYGQSTHAANPRECLSPLKDFHALIEKIESLNEYKAEDFYISTLTYMKLGEPSFGITPGEMTFYLTLRSAQDKLINQNKDYILNLIKETYKKPFEVSITEHDYFPTTMNHEGPVNFLQKTLDKLEYSYTIIDEPLKWSEDFGYYTQQIPGSYFGLGIGSQAPLHHPDYDFNDEVIIHGAQIYCELINIINFNQ